MLVKGPYYPVVAGFEPVSIEDYVVDLSNTKCSAKEWSEMLEQQQASNYGGFRYQRSYYSVGCDNTPFQLAHLDTCGSMKQVTISKRFGSHQTERST